MSEAVEVANRLLQVYADSLKHDGFADFKVEIKILKRGQKEVIVHSGKQYRFVLDFPEEQQSSKLFEDYQLVSSTELDRLKKGQAKSFTLARTS
ncbi:hypothetical protein [Thiomicrorhabdus heinhorstiae]|uniref:Uncharacterized protein n=1 Tax=Thiomicrorhabdus heinhorstiae TaxID=2748010 RepID=A0ABS0BU75_9GAMM|nr:hypothetical protein [Thiomicrorhabdus heinhorstiae]MBF6057390.1 hypothetical protein [Thiomicrorhabdus heinhorstiae]